METTSPQGCEWVYNFVIWVFNIHPLILILFALSWIVVGITCALVYWLRVKYEDVTINTIMTEEFMLYCCPGLLYLLLGIIWLLFRLLIKIGGIITEIEQKYGPTIIFKAPEKPKHHH